MGEKYSAYILELIRNNGITNADADMLNIDGGASNYFLLFDYFDVLYCKELCGGDKKYLNYLSIENVFEDTIQRNDNYKVSYKTLSLYCKSDVEERNICDIFRVESTGEYLSNVPFLGIIQITLCKENYVKEDWEKKGIDGFLSECEKKILEMVAKKGNSAISRWKLFRSSMTSDFCLVIRTNSVKEIYDISIALNQTRNDANALIKMLTFTNVGIECRYTKEKGYVTLSREFIDKCSEMTIALRFSADESMWKSLRKIKMKYDEKIFDVKGLFGRYEYLLYIGLEEFAEIYPFLCEKKIGKSSQDTRSTELSDLGKLLKRRDVCSINERILIEFDTGIKTDDELPVEEEADSSKIISADEKKEVLDSNKGLLDKIKALEKYKKHFYEEHFAFQDLLRGMKELYKAFSPTGMEKESYINWCVFQKDMKILCECIEKMMCHYETKIQNANSSINADDKKWYRGIVLGDWRNNLQAINRYTTLVQNINYQTYQSPIYEIQTQTDTEKAVVAYREAMYLYIANARKEFAQKGEILSEIYPIIYPALPTDTVEISAPFQIKSTDVCMSRRAIICTVPSFEYFGRLYDLLPWISHETSHHLRLIEREERNKFVTDYIFSNIFIAVMSEPFRRLSNCMFYKTLGEMERLLLYCMTEEANGEIAALKDFEKFNFEMLILKVEKWIKNCFPSGSGYMGQLHKEDKEQMHKMVFDFWLDTYRREALLTEEKLNEIMRVLDGEMSENNRDELVVVLLKKYSEDLCKKIKKDYKELISLQDMCSYEDFRAKLKKCIGKSDEEVAFKEYREKVIALYRIMEIDERYINQYVDCKKIETYLNNVFKRFQRQRKALNVYDVVSLHIMRNLGLLSSDSKRFVKEMQKIFKNVDNGNIMKHKETRRRIYLEACADLLMAISLKFDSFGYCRQMFQTVSDAKLMGAEYRYEDINYERWRNVTAVLLVREGARFKRINGKMILADASGLLKKGKRYCKAMVQHILQKICNSPEFIKKDEKSKELLCEFFKKIIYQTQTYLAVDGDRMEDILLLSALLYGKQVIKDDRIRKEWEPYEGVVEFCENFKYNFWRLDCFCRGIANIVRNGKVVASEKLFDHMMKISDKAGYGAPQGCCWENMNKSLIDPKLDVGNFYNEPEQVVTKTPEQKLENTIDFIQNYYYYNRFRIVNENGNTEEINDDDKICRKSGGNIPVCT